MTEHLNTFSPVAQNYVPVEDRVSRLRNELLRDRIRLQVETALEVGY